MEIGIITDEISADPETAIELGVEWGVSCFELRGFGTNRVPLLSSFQKSRIKELLDEFDVRIVAISPGLFKCPYPLGPRDRFPLRTFDKVLYEKWRKPLDRVNYHLQELLPLSIEYANEIGANTVVAFGFERSAQADNVIPDEVLVAFQEAAEQTGRAGLDLAIEVEAEFWVDTGKNAAEILRAVNHPALGVNWDPGNAFVAGDNPYPDGYEAVRDLVKHVHFKDVSVDPDGSYRYAVDGDIDWAGQIASLTEDDYEGFITVETHMSPKVRCARAMTERLQRLMAKASNAGRL